MEQKDFRHIVRVANTDLDGKKQVLYALTKIKGVNKMLANALCVATGIDKTKKVGELADEEVKKFDDVIRNPYKFRLPVWLYNRRRDPETGEDHHIVGPDVQFTKELDVKRMMKMKNYRGMRHSAGLPVRGQRTKSNFRASKRAGKGGRLGVTKRKARSGRV